MTAAPAPCWNPVPWHYLAQAIPGGHGRSARYEWLVGIRARVRVSSQAGNPIGEKAGASFMIPWNDR